MTPEQRERLNKIYGKPQAPGVMGLLGRALTSRPGQFALGAPSRLASEAEQRGIELGQAKEAGGFGGAFIHGLREFGSDVLDVTSDVTGGGIPESWGEELDPSRNTEIGRLVAAEKERIEREEGRPLGLIEEYDIMARFQDEANPWLTERHNIGPLSFSNRMLRELPMEAAMFIPEMLLTGGTAAAGIGAARGSAFVAGKVAASQAGRSAARQAAAQAGAKGIEGAGKAAKAALLIPRTIDNLAGAIIGTPIAFAFRQAAKPLAYGREKALGKWGTTALLNVFRRGARDHIWGGPAHMREEALDQIDRVAQQKVVIDGKQLGIVDQDVNLSRADTYDPKIDSPSREGFADVQVGLAPSRTKGTPFPFFGQTYMDATARANAFVALENPTAGQLKEASDIYLEVTQEGKRYLEWRLKKSGFLEGLDADIKVEANYGLGKEEVAGVDQVLREPSYYITGQISPKKIEEFERVIAEIADVDFNQDSVLIHYSHDAMTELKIPYLNNLPDGTLQETFEPMTSFRFSKKLKDEEVTFISETAEGLDLYGAAIHPDKKGVDFLHVSAYDADEKVGSVILQDGRIIGQKPDTEAVHFDKIERFVNAYDNRRVRKRGTPKMVGSILGDDKAVAGRRLRHYGRGKGQGRSGPDTLLGYDDIRRQHDSTTKRKTKRYRNDEERRVEAQRHYNQWYYSPDELASRYTKTGNDLIDKFAIPGNPSPSNGFNSAVQFVVDNVQDVLNGYLDTDILQQARRSLHSRFKNTPVLGRMTRPVVRLAKETAEERTHRRVAKQSVRQAKDANEIMETQIQSVGTAFQMETNSLVKALVDSGVLKRNVGGSVLRRTAKGFDAIPENNLDTGDLLGDLVEGSPDGNFAFSDDIFQEQPNRAALVGDDGNTLSFKGNTLIMVDALGTPIFYKDSAGKALGNIAQDKYGGRVATELSPGFTDVAERLPLYRKQLSAIKNVAKDPITGKEFNAYEVMEQLIAMPAQLEDALVKLGVKNVRAARGVLYDEGASYYPRNPLGEVVGGRLPAAGRFPSEIDIDMTGGGRWGSAIHERTYASQAEGMLNGQWNLSPGVSIKNYSDMVLGRVRNDRLGKFTQSVADSYNMRNGTARELIGEVALGRVEQSIGRVGKLLNSVIRRQAADLKLRQPELLQQAQDIITEMRIATKLASTLEPAASNDVIAAMKNVFEDLGGSIKKWDESITRMNQRKVLNAEEYKKLQALMKQTRSVYEALEKPALKDMGTLQGIGLEGHYFPLVLRNGILESQAAINKMSRGPQSAVAQFLNSMNSSLRMFGATGDMSAMGIQGWTTLLNDLMRHSALGQNIIGRDKVGAIELLVDRQGDAITAFKASWDALVHNGEGVVDDYMWRQHRIAANHGTLTPQELAEEGLAILENAPDLYMSQGSWLRKVPGITNVDRAFTHYGNVLRHIVADSEIQVLKATTGKSLKQLRDEGAIAEITAFANVLTGVGKRGYMGDAGQFIMFAPRFFEARMRMMWWGLNGLLPGSTKLQQRLASQYMSRFLGTATFLTFGINEMMGEATDINPLKRDPGTGMWRMNPNFMRIHLGDLDISLYGVWDSMLRITLLPLVATANGLQGGSLDQFVKDMRGIFSSPITTTGWDLATGADAIGRKTRPDDEDVFGSLMSFEALGTVMEHLVPFAWDEMIMSEPGKDSIMKKTFGGFGDLDDDFLGGLQDIGTGVTQAGLQVLGVKSTYETMAESTNKAMADFLALGPDDPLVREAFGVTSNKMTQSQLEAIYSESGKNYFDRVVRVGKDNSVSLSFGGILSEQTPKFDSIAGDIGENIKAMGKAGRFPEIMTPERMTEITEGLDARLKESAAPYDKYRIERDDLLVQEKDHIAQLETAFVSGKPLTYTYTDPTTGKPMTETYNISPGDFYAFYKAVSGIRGNYSRVRMNLIGPQGKYADVRDVFDYARESALGNVSAADADIFDTAETEYYRHLYEVVDNIPSIVRTDGTVDWDLRETKLNMWFDLMREKFPSVSEEGMKLFQRRVENRQKREAPPVISLLLDMQEFVGETELLPDMGYYDIEKAVATDMVSSYKAAEKAHYELWKDAGKNTKKDLEKLHPWLSVISERTTRVRENLIVRNPRLGGMLQVLEKGAKPTTPRAQEVATILSNHRLGRKKIQNMAMFLAAVFNDANLDEYK